MADGAQYRDAQGPLDLARRMLGRHRLTTSITARGSPLASESARARATTRFHRRSPPPARLPGPVAGEGVDRGRLGIEEPERDVRELRRRVHRIDPGVEAPADVDGARRPHVPGAHRGPRRGEMAVEAQRAAQHEAIPWPGRQFEPGLPVARGQAREQHRAPCGERGPRHPGSAGQFAAQHHHRTVAARHGLKGIGRPARCTQRPGQIARRRFLRVGHHGHREGGSARRQAAHLGRRAPHDDELHQLPPGVPSRWCPSPPARDA